ncbi:uncharacterized protein A4U43_C05F35800 [Asparagus officinalis]|uniref:Agenet domain-containing protein n=1 Tax=Asparagus officinalis TaxID=4686 RepID=A0A5P1EX48_ASPOF|nr:uncharacterized protein A4U43_C05F35800 [Asparagus officinalis]
MIRPRPPPANLATDFDLHQCVEAFYNGVWWKGVVTKVPGRDGDLLYSVCFPASMEEFQFKASEIWRQIKWVKGECLNVEDGDQVHGVTHFLMIIYVCLILVALLCPAHQLFVILLH